MDASRQNSRKILGEAPHVEEAPILEGLGIKMAIGRSLAVRKREGSSRPSSSGWWVFEERMNLSFKSNAFNPNDHCQFVDATRCATRLKRIDKEKAIVQSKVEGGKQLMKTFEPIVKAAKRRLGSDTSQATHFHVKLYILAREPGAWMHSRMLLEHDLAGVVEEAGSVHKAHNRMKNEPINTREACEEYGREVEKLDQVDGTNCHKLRITSKQVQRLLQRPNKLHPAQSLSTMPESSPCSRRCNTQGCRSLTILAQDDVGGLEVKRRVMESGFVSNQHPMLLSSTLVWSNERYESVEHRVMVNFERERFSIPFFLNPAHYTMVKPLEEMTDDQNPPKYKAYNWGKFFTTRKGSNFRKLDVENIQIYHFKVSK
uniref:Isopenicillin N synthase-like Fe(2+) 2OG dioxygenase domain-containing protein n=1 Tax=Cannabis sativa TaxID=3483 RepID=A0A803QRK3_CANSA